MRLITFIQRNLHNKILKTPKLHYYSTKSHYDIIIIGGNIVGSSMAYYLSCKLPHLQIALLDQKPKPISLLKLLQQKTLSFPNPRVFAVSPHNLDMLNPILSPIQHLLSNYIKMQIWENNGPGMITLTKQDLYNPFRSNLTETQLGLHSNVLGSVIEEDVLVSSIYDNITNVNTLNDVNIINLIAPDSNYDKTNPVRPVELICIHNDKKIELSSKLLIGADGKESFVRNSLGTFPMVKYDYGQYSLIFTVELKEGMERICYQKFLASGPIALLPVWDHKDKLYGNIVWTTTPEECKMLTLLSNQELISLLNENLQSGPIPNPYFTSSTSNTILKEFQQITQLVNNGTTLMGWNELALEFQVPPVIRRIIGNRYSFPLSCMHVSNYIHPRVALIGDAAHTMHPMAGQGLNMGLEDVQCLTNNLELIVKSGMGLESYAGLEFALQQYQTERKMNTIVAMGGLQFLQSIFGVDGEGGGYSLPLVYTRSLGMNLVNLVGPVRRRLVEYATGYSGLFGLKKYVAE